MINEQIRDKEVRVISAEGEQLGVMSAKQALMLAEQQQLDLVKIAPQATPPVCKLMDYGKYRFEAGKREKEAKKNQKVINIKEVRLSATIEEHDLNVKAKNTIKFLQDGDKVKVSIRFRGRQLTHPEIGNEVMRAYLALVSDYAVVDRPAKLEGRTMLMFLAPKGEQAKG